MSASGPSGPLVFNPRINLVKARKQQVTQMKLGEDCSTKNIFSKGLGKGYYVDIYVSGQYSPMKPRHLF